MSLRKAHELVSHCKRKLLHAYIVTIWNIRILLIRAFKTGGSYCSPHPPIYLPNLFFLQTEANSEMITN